MSGKVRVTFPDHRQLSSGRNHPLGSLATPTSQFQPTLRPKQLRPTQPGGRTWPCSPSPITSSGSSVDSDSPTVQSASWKQSQLPLASTLSMAGSSHTNSRGPSGYLPKRETSLATAGGHHAHLWGGTSCWFLNEAGLPAVSSRRAFGSPWGVTTQKTPSTKIQSTLCGLKFDMKTDISYIRHDPQSCAVCYFS